MTTLTRKEVLDKLKTSKNAKEWARIKKGIFNNPNVKITGENGAVYSDEEKVAFRGTIESSGEIVKHLGVDDAKVQNKNRTNNTEEGED